MFSGAPLEKCRVSTGIEIAYRTYGAGPPLLLLHGYPQNHRMWHKVAPSLAEKFTLVISDLRGYGDSDKPETDVDHAPYSFRAMAEDQASLMATLGHQDFFVAGHDRGARVVHRMCLDHPERIRRAAVLDIAPTLSMFEQTDMAFAMGYYHWFFLAQPAPLPETLIAADPGFVLRSDLLGWSKIHSGDIENVFDPDSLADYQRCFGDPATIHATCEDYRAAATIDLVHDRADRDAGKKITCPLLVLWGERGLVHRSYDVLEVWRGYCGSAVSGGALPCGHFLPEERPTETMEMIAEFFSR